MVSSDVWDTENEFRRKAKALRTGILHFLSLPNDIGNRPISMNFKWGAVLLGSLILILNFYLPNAMYLFTLNLKPRRVYDRSNNNDDNDSEISLFFSSLTFSTSLSIYRQHNHYTNQSWWLWYFSNIPFSLLAVAAITESFVIVYAILYLANFFPA